MIGSRPPFKVGQRVKASKEALAGFVIRRCHAERRGTVKKVDQWNGPTVLWDGRKTAASYHPDFIDPLTPCHHKPVEIHRPGCRCALCRQANALERASKKKR
jgi:hypothetical protein